MKVFVTGGAGFIGRHLVKSLLERNCKVTIFDNFSNSSKIMILSLLNNGAQLVKGDITIQDEISNAISGHDAVIHLAAKIDVKNSIKFPEETFMTNVNGTVNVLNVCVKHDVKNIVAASSTAVYGEPDNPNVPISENQKTNPLSPYAESKLKMEQHINSFSNKYNFNAIILRIFNVYGKGQSQEYAGVITKFIDRISKNESLEIFGDGLQTRDFVSIQDVVEAIQNSIAKLEGMHGRIFNIGSGKYTTIKSVAELLINLSRKKIAIKYFKQKEGDIKYSWADISLAKKYLNYYPKIEFDEGIKDLIKYL